MAGLLPLRLLSQPDTLDARGPSRLSRSSSTRHYSLAINNPDTVVHTSTGTRIIAPVMTHATRPRDRKEWKLVLDVARKLYAAGQYQDCTAYCINALELTRGLSHPLHVIYLSFYAATTTEKTAKEHFQSSQRKLELFLQACTYYRKALFYVPNASFTKKSPFHGTDFANLTHRPRSSLSTNNNYSGLNSDGSSRSSANDSVFSGIREYRDGTISPAPSTESEIVTDNLSSLRVGKRRHFQSKLPILISEPDLNTYLQPAVVPEDEEPSKALDSARASVQCRIASLNQASASCAALLNRSHTKRSSSLRSPLSPSNLMGESNRQSVSDFMKQRSISRYEEQLSNFEKQIKNHLRVVETVVQNLTQSPMKADEISVIRKTSSCSLSAPLTIDSARTDSKMSYRSHTDQEQNIKLPPIGYRSPSHFLPLPDTNPFRRNTDSLYNNIMESRGSHFGSSIGSSINFFDESKACNPEYDDEDMDRRGFESIEAVLESSWIDETWPASPPSIQKLDIAKGRSGILREVGLSHGNQGATAQHDDGDHSSSSRTVLKSNLSRCASPDGTFGSCPHLQVSDRDTRHLMDDTTLSNITQETRNEGSSLIQNADHIDEDSWF